MNITPEITEKLRAPFPLEKHYGNYNGFVYVDETAISERLDEIDPNWMFQILEVRHRDQQVFVVARLMLLGVSRDGIGEQSVETNSKGREVSEPEKGAATDALRRCGRLFGIGRYLLDDAPKITDGNRTAFEKWYRQRFNTAKPQVAKKSTNGSQNESEPEAETEIEHVYAPDGDEPAGTKHFIVTEVKFRKVKGKDVMVLTTDEGEILTRDSQPWKAAAFPVSVWWQTGGYKFQDAIAVNAAPAGDGMWVVSFIGSIPF